MRILFISNDGFDASLSRVPLSNWFYRNKKWVIDILSPRGHCMDLDAGICYELQNRGINWSNLCKINNQLLLCHFVEIQDLMPQTMYFTSPYCV